MHMVNAYFFILYIKLSDTPSHFYFFDCSFKLEIIYYYFFTEWMIYKYFCKNYTFLVQCLICVKKKDENFIYYHDISLLFKLSALKMADLKMKHIFVLFIFLLLYLFIWFEVLDITHARSLKTASAASLTSVRKPVCDLTPVTWKKGPKTAFKSTRILK